MSEEQIPPSFFLPQNQSNVITARTIASAITIIPLSAISFISGTAQIATIVPPFDGNHEIVLIFTDANPGTFLTTGNIGFAISPAQNTSVSFFFEARTKKYYPARTSGGAGNPSAPVNSVQFNNAGSFGGDADFTWDKTNNLINFTSSSGLSFAGAAAPITMVGGDDGFGDSAIIFDNPTDAYLVLKFNQFVDNEAANGWEVFNANGAILFEDTGKTTLQAGSTSIQVATSSIVISGDVSYLSTNTEGLAFLTEIGTPGAGTAHLVRLGGATVAAGDDVFLSAEDGQPGTGLSDQGRKLITYARPATSPLPVSGCSNILAGWFFTGGSSKTRAIELENKVIPSTGVPQLWLEEINDIGSFPFLKIFRENTDDCIIVGHELAGDKLSISVRDVDGGTDLKFLTATANNSPSAVLTNANGVAVTVQATNYNASDGSAGINTTITTASLVGKTITIKNGLITGFA